MEAFIRKRASLAQTGFFWGLCESQSQAEWVKDEMKSWLASQLQNRNISLPGVQLFEPKKSGDDGSMQFAPPVLEVLKLCPDGMFASGRL